MEWEEETDKGREGAMDKRRGGGKGGRRMKGGEGASLRRRARARKDEVWPIKPKFFLIGSTLGVHDRYSERIFLLIVRSL